LVALVDPYGIYGAAAAQSLINVGLDTVL